MREVRANEVDGLAHAKARWEADVLQDGSDAPPGAGVTGVAPAELDAAGVRSAQSRA